MRPHRTPERGSATVVVLILVIMMLLAFIVMWFMQKDDIEKAQKAEKAAIAAEENARQAASAFLQYAEGLSRVVGYLKVNATELPGLSEAGKSMGGNTVLTKIEDLEANLRPDGQIAGEGGVLTPGLLNWLKTNAFVEIAAEYRTGKEEAVKEDRADFGWMTQPFKDKLREVAGLTGSVPAAPKPPTDLDDAAAKAEYEAKLQEYEAAMAKLRQATDELAGMEGYRRYEEIIKGGRLITDEAGLVRLNFFTEGAEAQPTIQSLLEAARKPVAAIKGEFIANKKADVARVGEVGQEKVALEEALQTTKKALEDEQKRHTDDVAQLQRDVTDANSKAEANRVEASTATNRVQQLEEEKKRIEATATREISARDERIRQDKAKRDLEIRRDDADGAVLAVNSTMRTAQINLGSADKVFTGLRFAVSAIGRGGLREPRGEVIVTRVTGAHSAQVAILAEVDPRAPVLGGDIIHNPFYSAGEPVHVFLAGTLDKWPKTIAVERLRRLGVVVDEAIHGKTDYVIVPNSMTAPAAAPAAEGEEGAAEGPKPGQSEFERISSLARSFGANVITERVLDAFLDF